MTEISSQRVLFLWINLILASGCSQSDQDACAPITMEEFRSTSSGYVESGHDQKPCLSLLNPNGRTIERFCFESNSGNLQTYSMFNYASETEVFNLEFEGCKVTNVKGKALYPAGYFEVDKSIYDSTSFIIEPATLPTFDSYMDVYSIDSKNKRREWERNKLNENRFILINEDMSGVKDSIVYYFILTLTSEKYDFTHTDTARVPVIIKD